MKLWLIKLLADGIEYDAIKTLAAGKEKETILKLIADRLGKHHLHKNPTKDKKPTKEKRPKLVGDSYFVGAGKAIE